MSEKYYLNLSIENIFGEYWKDIGGFNGLYQVSNKGRVKAMSKFTTQGAFLKERIRKQVFSPKGYLAVSLYLNKKTYGFRVHRLVAKEFILNPQNKPHINHLKEKWNNCVEQLKWCTSLENNKHAWLTGRQSFDNYPERKARLPIIKKVKKCLVRRQLTQIEIAEKFNLPVHTISFIWNNRSWSKVDPQVNKNKVKYVSIN